MPFPLGSHKGEQSLRACGLVYPAFLCYGSQRQDACLGLRILTRRTTLSLHPAETSVVVSPVGVLVVEDEAIRHVLEAALTDGGYAVAGATTGDEAIAMLNADEADYGALITDIDLPGEFSGWDVARRAREINGAMPVMYISGASAHDWALQGVPNSQIMPKPFAVAQVLTSISQLINAAANSVEGRVLSALAPAF
jgi:CheY-like chemotaxis protein